MSIQPPPSMSNVSGTPFDCGQQIGRVRGREIGRCVEDWRQSLAAAGIDDVDAYLDGFLRDTEFKNVVRRSTPELFAEVEGMASGADIAVDLLLAAQFMDEEWAYRGTISAKGGQRDKCSSVAIVGVDDVIVGQNMDLGGYTDGHQVATSIRHDGTPGVLLFSISAMIGLMGINDLGVAVCVNSLPQLPDSRTGLPVAFVIRHTLAARSGDEAAERLKSVAHATGQHYLVADRLAARSFEASAAGIARYIPSDPAVILHTNHPLADVETEVPGNENSVARLRALERRLHDHAATVDDVKDALKCRADPEHPVSRTKDPVREPGALTGMIGFTTGSMVSAISRYGSDTRTWISAGPPSAVEYREVSAAQA